MLSAPGVAESALAPMRLISNFCLFRKIFIQGLINLNRAVNEDIVCVEVLPEKDWTCPSSIVIDEDIKEDEAEESTTKQVCSISLKLLHNRRRENLFCSYRWRKITIKYIFLAMSLGKQTNLMQTKGKKFVYLVIPVYCTSIEFEASAENYRFS